MRYVDEFDTTEFESPEALEAARKKAEADLQDAREWSAKLLKTIRNKAISADQRAIQRGLLKASREKACRLIEELRR